MIATANLTTLDEMKQAALERRKRIFGNPKNNLEIENRELRRALADARADLDELRSTLAAEVKELRHEISEHQRAAIEYMRQMDDLRLEMNHHHAPVHRESVRDIVLEVLERHPGISFEDLLSVRRSANLVEARHEAVYEVFKRRPDLSYPRIGRFFHRDHTSILSAVRKMKARESEAA